MLRNLLIIALGLTLLTSQAIAAPQITMGNAAGKPGAVVKIPLTLDPQGMDLALIAVESLTFDSAMLENPVVEAGPVAIAAGKGVSAVGTNSAGDIRFLVSGWNNNTIQQGIVAYLSLTIKNGASEGEKALSISGTVNPPDASTDVPFIGVAGGITIDATAPDAPVFTQPSGNAILGMPKPVFGGTAETGSTVKVAAGATQLGSTTASDGTWSVTSSVALTDGSYNITATATDAAGNTGDPATITVTVDTTAPETTITSRPAALTNATTATFSFTATEADSTFQCSLDGAPFVACTSPAAYTALSAGNHSFSVKATDPAGNSDPTPATANWSIDLTPPDTGISSQPANPTKETTATFSFTATEAGATFQCSLDAAPFDSCTSPVVFTDLGDGSHTFTVQATDPAGNSDPTPATSTWTIDLSIPVAVLSNTPAAVTKSTTATITVGGTGVVAYKYQLDAGAQSAERQASTLVSLTALAQGVHTLKVWARNTVGTWQIDPTIFQWTVDTAPPTAVLSGQPSGFVNTGSATIEVGGNGVATYKYRLDAQAFGAGTSVATPIALSNLASGLHTLAVIGCDEAGNWQVTPTTVSWTVDTTPPAVPVVTGAPVGTNRATTATLTVAGIDVVKYRYELDGGDVSADFPVATKITLSELADGEHTVNVFGIDRAGNLQPAPRTVTWTVDTMPPVATLTDAPTGTVKGGAKTATVGGDGVTLYRYKLQRSGATTALYSAARPVTQAISLSLTVSGEYTLSVVGGDAAGNWQPDGEATTASFTVDATPPAAPLFTAPAAASVINDSTPTFTGTAEAGSTVTLMKGTAQIGTAEATDGTWSLTPAAPLADGLVSVTATATDVLGNKSAARLLSFTVDTTVPAVPVVTGAPVGTTRVTTVTLTVTGTGVVMYRYALDGGVTSGDTPVATKIVLGGLAEGSHTVSVFGIDRAGNVQPTPRSVTWTVDTTAPVAALTGAPTGIVKGGAKTVTVGGDGVTRYRYKLQRVGAPSALYSAVRLTTQAISLSLTVSGDYMLSVIGADAAGNWQTEAEATTASFTVDTLPPALTVPTAVTTTSTTYSIAGTVEPGATVTVATNTAASDGQATVTGGLWTYEITGLVAGINTVRVIATDAVGNAITKSFTITKR